MSTRRQYSKRTFAGPAPLLGRTRDAGAHDRYASGGLALGLLDLDEAVALVASSRRELLLVSHSHRLGREDLEDCYSQATLELLTRARRGPGFVNTTHVAKALEQKFLSRIHDRHRALGGRSPIQAALANSLPLIGGACNGVEMVDARADVERLAFLRHDLRRVARLSRQLSADQRLVLASELSGESGCEEFCRRHGWSKEKYRKVAQRARARLLRLHAEESARVDGESARVDGRSARVDGQFARAEADAPVPFACARRISQQGHTYETSSPHT